MISSRDIIRTMSFGFGVGDILQLTEIIVTTISNIRDAPTELRELGERIDLVDLNLQSINNIPPTAVEGNTQNTRKLVDRITKVLNEIKDIVDKYGNTDGWKKAFSRAKYGILRPQIDQIFSSIRQEQESTKDDESPSQDTDATVHQISSEALSDGTRVPNQSDLAQSVLERVIHSDQPSDVASPSNHESASIEREIEIQLEQAGIEPKFTKALMDIIDKQRRRLAHPEDIDPLSFIGGKNKLENAKGWILVVDDLNEGIKRNLDLV